MEVHQNVWFFHGSIDDHFQLIELTIYHLLMQKEEEKNNTLSLWLELSGFSNIIWLPNANSKQSSNNR